MVCGCLKWYVWEKKNGPVIHRSDDILCKNPVVFLGVSGYSFEEK